METKMYNNGRLLTLFALLPLLSHAQFSVRMNLGLSNIGHETRAQIIQDLDEIIAYEALDNFRRGDTTIAADYVFATTLEQIFVLGSNAGTAWEHKTQDVYLAPVVVDPNDSNSRTLKVTTDTFVTGSDTNGATTNFAVSTLRITISDGLTFSPSGLSTYTNAHSDNKDVNAYIIKDTHYTLIERFRDEIAPTIDKTSKFLTGQHHYNSLDLGINLIYDFGALSLTAIVMGHHPMETANRTTVTDLIDYQPDMTFDASLGTMIKLYQSRIGALVGWSRITGHLELSKYRKNVTNGLTTGLTDISYIDYTNSYNLGLDSVTYNALTENIYFGEVRVEGIPLTQRGITFYGAYRVSVGLDDEDQTQFKKVDVEQTTVSVGLNFALYD